MKIDQTTYEYYMQDSMYDLKEFFNEAQQEEIAHREKQSQDWAFYAGERDAYHHALVILRNQAITFGLPLQKISLDDPMLPGYQPTKPTQANIDKTTYEQYLKATTGQLRASFYEVVEEERAHEGKQKEDWDFATGKRVGFYATLLRLRNQAIGFALPLKKIGLGEPIKV